MDIMPKKLRETFTSKCEYYDDECGECTEPVELKFDTGGLFFLKELRDTHPLTTSVLIESLKVFVDECEDFEEHLNCNCCSTNYE